MRVCPKCGHIDPRYWRHAKWSYHVDTISYENFQHLHPQLAHNLRKGGDLTEDENYVYRLAKTKTRVQRKAKIDFGKPPKTLHGLDFSHDGENYERFNHKSPYHTDMHDFRKYWERNHPDQAKLLKWNGDS